MIYTAAARFAEPLTDDSSKAEGWDMKAYGSPSEMQQGGYFAIAKQIDAQQRPSQEASGDYSLIDVR